MKIIEDNGTVVLTVDSAYWGPVYNTSQGAKLLTYISNYPNLPYRVYGLPGTYYQLKSIHNVSENYQENNIPFPNPTDDIIHLTYYLKSGEHGLMKIINNIGQDIQQYKIDSNFTDILFDTKKLPSGSYFYYVLNGNCKSETKQFIKN